MTAAVGGLAKGVWFTAILRCANVVPACCAMFLYLTN